MFQIFQLVVYLFPAAHFPLQLAFSLIVANADINIGSQTPNQVFEISPQLPGGFVGSPLQLDSGTPGALFGMVATVDGQGNQIVYFNDDNANAVMKITVGP